MDSIAVSRIGRLQCYIRWQTADRMTMSITSLPLQGSHITATMLSLEFPSYSTQNWGKGLQLSCHQVECNFGQYLPMLEICLISGGDQFSHSCYPTLYISPPLCCQPKPKFSGGCPEINYCFFPFYSSHGSRILNSPQLVNLILLAGRDTSLLSRLQNYVWLLSLTA